MAAMKPLHACNISSPKDLEGRSLAELEALCVEIRHHLIEKVNASGGHLGSNLGVVELTVAMHKVFDFSRDKLVFDVSHQCYPHKMLTGRFDGFDSLRQTNGMSGFINRDESPYDMLTAGHAGTSISFASGLAAGMKGSASDGDDPWAVALIGDAAFGSGVAFEGINQAADNDARMIVVLNDNEWSIAKSVGAMARYLSRIRSSQTLHRTYERLSALAHKLPIVGSRMDEIGEVLRHVMVPGHIFEELGVNYIGPLDGHDLDIVTDALERAKKFKGVTLIHFLTEKGKGFAPASTDPERAHGVKPPSKVPAASTLKPAKSAQSFTAAFSESLCRLADKNSHVHAITAGMPSGTGLGEFSERFGERFHDTGITEQHAVSLAGGLATAGKRPVVAIYSTFLQRGYDQVFQEVALQKENVVFCLDRAGLVGQDGPTHMGLYDIAYLRPFPGVTLCAPRDAADLGRMLELAVDSKGPWALRWPRATAQAESFIPKDLREPLVAGRAECLRQGDAGTVFALGELVNNAVLAADELEKLHGISLAVFDARFVKPIDELAILNAAKQHDFIATVEEHSVIGGLGSAVGEVLANHSRHTKEKQCRLSIHGVPDDFIMHMTSRDEQLLRCNLDVESLMQSWRSQLQNTNCKVNH
ncbi:MAG: 1-deoxy-D-xylulose-5-phosphate synthase [Myxococcota bacterium]|jgi:1-deoxy-D-xylulose-5-phosphate synthase